MTNLKYSKNSPSFVGDIMTKRVVTLAPHSTFEQAVALMANYSFRHFLVVDASGKLAGVVSDRNILRALARTVDWKTKEVSQFMTSEVVTVTPGTPISHAVSTMLSMRINCLPVVDGNHQVCGILTSTDLLKTFRVVQEALEDNHMDSIEVKPELGNL